MNVVSRENSNIVGGIVGTFRHTLDPKKRLTIPSEWRDVLGVTASEDARANYVYVIPNETEPCLDLVPMFEMQTLREKMAEQDILANDPVSTAIWQVAQMLKVDASGRIRVGDDLLEFAGITGEVTLIGSFRKAQIWAGEKKPKKKTLGIDVAAYRAAVAQCRKAGKGKA